MVCPLRPPGRGSESWSSKGIGFRHGDEHRHPAVYLAARRVGRARPAGQPLLPRQGWRTDAQGFAAPRARSEEHTSELQSPMRISYAVFCLTQKQTKLIDDIYRSVILLTYTIKIDLT